MYQAHGDCAALRSHIFFLATADFFIAPQGNVLTLTPSTNSTADDLRSPCETIVDPQRGSGFQFFKFVNISPSMQGHTMSITHLFGSIVNCYLTISSKRRVEYGTCIAGFRKWSPSFCQDHKNVNSQNIPVWHPLKIDHFTENFV